jgi:hypothetical protein
LPGVLLAWKRSLSTGGPYEIEHRLRRFDGIYRWFQARALPERRADGGIVRWYLLLTDIEDHKRSEELARQSQLTIRSIIDSIPVTDCTSNRNPLPNASSIHNTIKSEMRRLDN